MANFSSLPPEIVREILSYVGVPTQLAFGQTCKFNRSVQLISPSALRLSVFPTKIGNIASLLANDDELSRHGPSSEAVQVVLGREKSRSKDMVVDNQNAVAGLAAKKLQNNIHSLDVAMWDLQQSTAAAIAQLKRLRNLSIRLDHPTTRFKGVDPAFWTTSPGSTAWNEFYARENPGGGKARSVFGRLKTLRLERSGITDYQLLRIVEENPDLEVLSLRKCMTISEEFFEALAASPAAKRLKVLVFTHSDHEEIDGRILKHLDSLTALESLSLLGCPRIDDDEVRERQEKTWRISRLVLPRQEERLDEVMDSKGSWFS